ncbi:hypothetical protein BCR32DRAFT_290936 [Anaeromyces robustus]|uniref:RlpA-like protein double-psi beta-barrel domain-containing protein n=1 Tax=Anaeromyces robustus TaxID=1754192 RepID=A0A1Y1XH46_9FUNG|nr:hypothetical protein BCR32DRAFT_290936 [Anaeromyces robustus]|eukprot:ORX85080.1 hypothetical protein BCR32DRAFT_290936 [Anaeromyces robustus]
MKYLKKILLNTLLFSVIQCDLLKREKGSIDDFSDYSKIKDLIEDISKDYDNSFNTIFKDGPIYKGEGTAYGSSTNGGSCMFPAKEFYKDMMYAALNNDQYINDLGCGACAVVISTSRPYKPIRVRIIDRCSECKHGDLDFSDKAYKALTNESPGRVKITWSLIPCDISIESYSALVQPDSKIKFKFKTGSTSYWTEFQIYNTRYPVAKCSVKIKDKYISLKRRDHNYWYREDNSSMGSGSFTFKVELADGTIIDATDVELKVPDNDEDGVYSTGKQTVTGGTKKSSFWKKLFKTILLIIIIILVVGFTLGLSIILYNKYARQKIEASTGKSLPPIPVPKSILNSRSFI